MKRFTTMAAALAVILLFAASAWAGPWTIEARYGDFHVVVAEDAIPSEHHAAREFQSLWEASTGHQPTLSHEEDPERLNVWIGAAGCRFAKDLPLDELGADGYAMRTFRFRQRLETYGPAYDEKSRVPLQFRHLVIAGDAPRGTLYGVYAFFREYMGVRFLTPSVTHFPEPPAVLPKIRRQYTPDIPYRDTNFWVFTRNPEFAARHHLNGNSNNLISEEQGGYLGYAGGFCHTFYQLVPPDKYFDAHPEYFSLVNGKRMRKSQLCLTNPEVLRITIEAVRKILREAPPHRRIVSVTQNDWPFWCECESCAALDEHEGSQAGTMIHFVNAVADAVAPEFPGALIDTFAYTYTRKPPKHVRPRDNVVVRLCSIECDFSRPLDSRKSRLNRAFKQDIKDWSRISKQLHIWDYTQNWHAFQGPHPNYHVLQPNIAFFRDHGVSGMFEQAAHGRGSDFAFLKAYIIGRALWNPDLSGEALYDEFMQLYYQEAAAPLRAYHELILGKVRQDDYALTIFSEFEWMDAATIAKAQALFDEAMDAVRGNAELIERVRRARLAVEYAALTCYPEVELAGGKYILRRPPSLTFEAYWDRLMEYEVTHLEDKPIAAFRERLDGKTPPRYRELPIHVLENERYTVWVLPEINGSIVRFQDKQSGADAFTAHDDPLNDQGKLQEWTLTNPDNMEREEVVAGEYELVREDDGVLVMRARMENGLDLTRTLELPEGGGPLRYTLEIRNTASEPRKPYIKVHPEFAAPGGKVPALALLRDGAWVRHPLNMVDDGKFGVERITPTGVAAWAFEPAKGAPAVISHIEPEQLDMLLYFYARDGGHMNLEMAPKLDPLAPGETRTVTATYGLAAELP